MVEEGSLEDRQVAIVVLVPPGLRLHCGIQENGDQEWDPASAKMGDAEICHDFHQKDVSHGQYKECYAWLEQTLRAKETHSD